MGGNGSGGGSSAAIAGVVIGALVGIAALAALLLKGKQRRDASLIEKGKTILSVRAVAWRLHGGYVAVTSRSKGGNMAATWRLHGG